MEVKCQMINEIKKAPQLEIKEVIKATIVRKIGNNYQLHILYDAEK